jgi:methionyl-tRNA synthetase
VLEAIRQVAVLTWPVMPGKCEQILEALGLTLSPGADSFEDLTRWGAGWPATIAIRKPAAVFPKYSNEDLSQTFDISPSEPTGSEPAGAANGGSDKKMLSFDRFKELDLRLARIIDAAKVEGATKLIRMTVDLGGGDQRQMVAGIAEGYSPEELKGRTIVVVANLEPAKIRGIESQAMLLAAVGEGRIALVGPDKELLPGTRVS